MQQIYRTIISVTYYAGACLPENAFTMELDIEGHRPMNDKCKIRPCGGEHGLSIIDTTRDELYVNKTGLILKQFANVVTNFRKDEKDDFVNKAEGDGWRMA